MNTNRPKSTLATLKEGGVVRLGGLTVIEITSVGTPLLKATLSAQPLEADGEVSVYDNDNDNWRTVEDPSNFAVGLGDRIMIGHIQILISAYSKKYGEIRMSLRTEDAKTARLINEYKGRIR